MDHKRFEALTRWLAAATSRRATIQTLAASALAVGLGLRGREEAAAKCVKPGKTCKRKHGKTKKCCGGVKCKGKRCQCLGGAPRCGKTKTCCQPGQVCQGDFCVPDPGTCPTDGADYCNSGFTDPCNDNPQCHCYTTMANATRCAAGGGIACGSCTSDADCLNDPNYGPGAFCAKDTGSGCGCPDGEGFCKLPCPS